MEIRERIQKISPYSINPIETANYKPELLELLDCPSIEIINQKKFVEELA